MGGHMMEQLQIEDWLILIAFVLLISGPRLAVDAQRFLEGLRDRKQRRMNLFYTLMSTRLSYEHVRALDLIGLEFGGNKLFGNWIQLSKKKAVTNACKNYNDQLGQPYTTETLPAWNERCLEMLTELLYVMSRALGHDFDEGMLKRVLHARRTPEREIDRERM